MRKIAAPGTVSLLILLLSASIIGCQEEPAPATPAPTPEPTTATATPQEQTPLSQEPEIGPEPTPEPTPILLPTPTEPPSVLETKYEVYLAQSLPSESNVWLDLMRIIPIGSTTLMSTSINDYSALRKALGIPLPDPDAATEVLNDYKLSLLGGEDMMNHLGSEGLSGIFESYQAKNNPELTPSVEEWCRTLGFTWANVDQSVYLGPVGELEVVRGRFNRDNIDQAVRSGPLNDVLEDVSYQGIEYYSWDDEDRIHMDWRSAVRPLGRGHQLALIGDYVFWTRTPVNMEMTIDCYLGAGLSLAWVEEYQLLSQGLAELGTYTAFFTAETRSLNYLSWSLSELWEKTEDEVRGELENKPLLETYQALATGIGVDEQGYFMAVVLVHANNQATQQNVQLLEQQIRETSSLRTGEEWTDLIDSMEISSQDRLTLAKLYGNIALYWLYLAHYSEHEILLVHK